MFDLTAHLAARHEHRAQPRTQAMVKLARNVVRARLDLIKGGK